MHACMVIILRYKYTLETQFSSSTKFFVTSSIWLTNANYSLSWYLVFYSIWRFDQVHILKVLTNNEVENMFPNKCHLTPLIIWGGNLQGVDFNEIPKTMSFSIQILTYLLNLLSLCILKISSSSSLFAFCKSNVFLPIEFS